MQTTLRGSTFDVWETTLDGDRVHWGSAVSRSTVDAVLSNVVGADVHIGFNTASVVWPDGSALHIGPAGVQ